MSKLIATEVKASDLEAMLEEVKNGKTVMVNAEGLFVKNENEPVKPKLDFKAVAKKFNMFKDVVKVFLNKGIRGSQTVYIEDIKTSGSYNFGVNKVSFDTSMEIVDDKDNRKSETFLEIKGCVEFKDIDRLIEYGEMVTKGINELVEKYNSKPVSNDEDTSVKEVKKTTVAKDAKAVDNKKSKNKSKPIAGI